MTPNEVVKIAAKALSDKKGKDIKVLKTDKLTSLCDYFIICTGTSSTHIKTLTDEIDKAMSEAGEPPHPPRGLSQRKLGASRFRLRRGSCVHRGSARLLQA